MSSQNVIMSNKRSARICKTCHSADIHRITRRGFFQRKVYALFGLYPWECPHCRQISMLRDRGFRRKYSPSGYEETDSTSSSRE